MCKCVRGTHVEDCKFMNTPRRLLVFVCVAFLAMAFAEVANSNPAETESASEIAKLDAYVRLLGGVLVVLIAMIGAPVSWLTYKKTQVEITKLKLEAAAVQQKLHDVGDRTAQEDGSYRIAVENSPNTTVQILADPRFLAPLLLLLDFIFAWVVLSLAGYLLSVFTFGMHRSLVLAIMAAILLLPIAKQVLRVRAVLNPPNSPEETAASIRQARIAVYAVYSLVTVSLIAVGALLLVFDPGVLDEWERYFVFGLIGLGTLFALLIPFLKRRFDRYIESLVDPARL